MANYLIALLIAATVTTPSCKSMPGALQAPRSTELSFKVADLTLEGTFEVPAGPAKAPALLLLPGSGPTDRNGNSSLGITTDLLKNIADDLARNGVASFRFDKRAVHHYSATWPKGTEELNRFFAWEKFVDDAKAALKFLASQPEVDANRVGLLGHSEGSLISLQVASDLQGKPGAPKALVLLGSTGRPMGIILHEQIERALKLQGAGPDVMKTYLDYTDAASSALASYKPLPPNTPNGLVALFNPVAADIVGAYCRIDPAVLAKHYSGPVLVINGQNDTQVSAERDTPRLVEALKSRPGSFVDFFIAPDASHNLKSTKSGGDDAFTGPIVPGASSRIVTFTSAHL